MSGAVKQDLDHIDTSTVWLLNSKVGEGVTQYVSLILVSEGGEVVRIAGGEDKVDQIPAFNNDVSDTVCRPLRSTQSDSPTFGAD
ncbi:hypothetical protein H2200_008497 [Cladophialophora chaetospira]|uniref:Uncharacterized protein n=1 Tax=Cladophialophora chaetospira TaxID=386627 RepID=A0AA38X6A7_9EURO|nr:hypothetical protein H2200_008497 [Cladophialophora chaetospira]